jgi:hypothetical protein
MQSLDIHLRELVTKGIITREEAMKKAQDQHAEYFAPEDWSAAKQAWDQAQAKLESKSYGDATTLLLKAQTRFRKATDISTGKRQDAIREIEGLHKTAELRCKALKEAMEKGKLPQKPDPTKLRENLVTPVPEPTEAELAAVFKVLDRGRKTRPLTAEVCGLPALQRLAVEKHPVLRCCCRLDGFTPRLWRNPRRLLRNSCRIRRYVHSVYAI